MDSLDTHVLNRQSSAPCPGHREPFQNCLPMDQKDVFGDLNFKQLKRKGLNAFKAN